jgi:hypothetical protein
MGNETLYIASDAGRITAIAMPEFTPASLVSLSIAGPTRVIEGSTVAFEALASYDDGRVRDRSELTHWSVEADGDVSIDETGELSVGELFSPEVEIVVRAAYEERGVAAADEVEVKVVIGVTVDDFVRRNLEGAVQSKQEALERLHEAQEREAAARNVLENGRRGAGARRSEGSRSPRTLHHLIRAIFWGEAGERSTERSVEELKDALGSLDEPSPGPGRHEGEDRGDER